MKRKKNYYILPLFFLTLSIIFFKSVNAACNECIPYEQQINYLKESFNSVQSDLVFKMRLIGVSMDDNISNMPPTIGQIPSSKISLSHLLRFGYGIDSSIGYFVTDNMALELSVGVAYFYTNRQLLEEIYQNYNGQKLKRGATYFIPCSIIAQYHPAPYGGIQPYIGGGYHIAPIISRTRGMNINKHNGPLLQIGVDLVFKDLTLLNFEIKKYFSSPNITFKTPLVNRKFISKFKTNPLIFSAGIGFKL